MRINSLLFKALCVLVCFSSCQDDEEFLLTEEHGIDTLFTSKTITEIEAKAIAQDFLDNFYATTRSTSERSIGEVHAWKTKTIANVTRSQMPQNKLPDTLMYIVNLQDDKGYLIVSADKRYEKVLAYVDEGNLSPTDKIDNPGFQLFIEGVGKLFTSGLPSFTDTTQNRDFDFTIIQSISPILVKTRWHQNSPFNDQCPLINGVHAKAGCGPIATAQVLAYHKDIDSYNGYVYNWDSISVTGIPNTAVGREGAAHLVHSVGVLESANYGSNSTGVDPNNIATCFYTLDYHYTKGGYTYDRCHTEINNERPVIIIGYTSNNQGHGWVIDGYYSIIRLPLNPGGGPDPMQSMDRSDYVHCNWGWTSSVSADGYYLSHVFDTQQKKYDNDLSPTTQQPSYNYYFSQDLEIYYQIYKND